MKANVSSPSFLPDLPGPRVGEGDHGVVGVLHSPQAGLQMVGRTEEVEGKKPQYIRYDREF